MVSNSIRNNCVVKPGTHGVISEIQTLYGYPIRSLFECIARESLHVHVHGKCVEAEAVHHDAQRGLRPDSGQRAQECERFAFVERFQVPCWVGAAFFEKQPRGLSDVNRTLAGQPAGRDALADVANASAGECGETRELGPQTPVGFAVLRVRGFRREQDVKNLFDRIAKVPERGDTAGLPHYFVRNSLKNEE